MTIEQRIKLCVLLRRLMVPIGIGAIITFMTINFVGASAMDATHTHLLPGKVRVYTSDLQYALFLGSTWGFAAACLGMLVFNALVERFRAQQRRQYSAC